MKNLLLFIALFIGTGFMESDETIKELTKANWKVDEQRLTFGSKVLRMEGENKGGFSVTNIAYQDLNSIIDEKTEKQKREMKTEEESAKEINMYKKECIGGVIMLYLERITIDWANTENFTVIIQDSLNNEMFRRKLKSRIAKVPNQSLGKEWNNFALVNIDTPLTKPFTIYFIDGLARNEDATRYVFKVVN